MHPEFDLEEWLRLSKGLEQVLGNETAAKAKAFKAKTAAVAIVDFPDSPEMLVRCGLPCLGCPISFSPSECHVTFTSMGLDWPSGPGFCSCVLILGSLCNAVVIAELLSFALPMLKASAFVCSVSKSARMCPNGLY